MTTVRGLEGFSGFDRMVVGGPHRLSLIRADSSERAKTCVYSDANVANSSIEFTVYNRQGGDDWVLWKCH